MKNMFQQLVTIIVVCLGLSTPILSHAEESKYGHQKVVYHVNYDSVDRQMAALRNTQNQINAVGEKNIEAIVVMHGKGLSLLKNAKTNLDLQSRITNLKMQGVKFDVCANTMKSKKIALGDLFDASQDDIVPSGVAELTYLQSKGFTYLRP